MARSHGQGQCKRWHPKAGNLRKVMLVAQIGICAVLVTSSLVALRALIYSLHAQFRFNLENTMLAETDLPLEVSRFARAWQLLTFIVYQAMPRDPLTLGAVVLAMAILGLVATLSVDPSVLLRKG